MLDSSECPPVPIPILESQVLQSPSLLAMIPILALEQERAFAISHVIGAALNPSLLQCGCKEACEPMSFFHVFRLNEVARYFPSAISEKRELACRLMTMNLI